MKSENKGGNFVAYDPHRGTVSLIHASDPSPSYAKLKEHLFHLAETGNLPSVTEFKGTRFEASDLAYALADASCRLSYAHANEGSSATNSRDETVLHEVLLIDGTAVIWIQAQHDSDGSQVIDVIEINRRLKLLLERIQDESYKAVVIFNELTRTMMDDSRDEANDRLLRRSNRSLLLQLHGMRDARNLSIVVTDGIPQER